MTTMNNIAVIKKDRLRYSKNKLSSWLALLAIVFDCLYFVSIYSSDVGTYYYTWQIGLSVLYNLVFLLTAFLSSEGVKNYKLSYSYILILVGALQVVRIFYSPLTAYNTTDPTLTADAVAELTAKGERVPSVMGDFQFWYCTICLVASAALCVISGVIAFIKTTTLNKYQAELDKNSRGSKS